MMQSYKKSDSWKEEVASKIKDEMNKYIVGPKVDTVKFLDVLTDSDGNKHMGVIIKAGQEISSFELKFTIKK